MVTQQKATPASSGQQTLPLMHVVYLGKEKSKLFDDIQRLRAFGLAEFGLENICILAQDAKADGSGAPNAATAMIPCAMISHHRRK